MRADCRMRFRWRHEGPCPRSLGGNSYPDILVPCTSDETVLHEAPIRPDFFRCPTKSQPVYAARLGGTPTLFHDSPLLHDRNPFCTAVSDGLALLRNRSPTRTEPSQTIRRQLALQNQVHKDVCPRGFQYGHTNPQYRAPCGLSHPARQDSLRPDSPSSAPERWPVQPHMRIRQHSPASYPLRAPFRRTTAAL